MKLVVIGAHRERNDIEPLAAAIAVSDLWLSGMAVEESQPLGDRDLLLRVAKTRAALLDRATFVAIRYGFTAHGSDDAFAKCAAHLDRWRRVLNDFRDHVEMTLKIAAAVPRARPDRHDFETGSAYIRALHEATRATDVAPEFRKAVDETLVPLTVKHRWSNRDTSSLEFAALVKRDDVAAINDAGSALKRDFPSVPFLFSGPWPLEVFADDHE